MPREPLENRLDALAAEVAHLKHQMARLEECFATDGIGSSGQQTAVRLDLVRQDESEPPPSSEELWSWLGKASLLPRIATISFALVVALLLRTLTDSKVIALQTGSYIGLAYASLLVALGWWLHARQSRLAPVLPVCGAILMFLVVLEAHARFHALSSLTSYNILLLALAGLVLLGSRYGFPFLNTLGLVGAGLTGLAIDFPDPVFALVALFLLVPNSVAYLTANRPSGTETARWGLFVLTAVLWLNWTIKLQAALAEGLALSPPLGGSWFMPLLLVYLAGYTAMTLHRAFGVKGLSALDLLMPTMSGLLFYLAARSLAIPWWGELTWVGVAGLGWSVLLFSISVLAVYRRGESSRAACVFTIAGAGLLLVTIPDVTGSLLLSLPVWSVGALFLMKLSRHCEIGGIRLASYLLQVAACAWGVVSGSFSILAPQLPLSLAVAAGLTSLSGYHYWVSRKNPMVCSVGFFAKVDPGDQTAMALLLVTVVNGFSALQLVAAFVLAGSAADFATILNGLRSVFLNGGAFLLMVLGLRGRNKEILAVALAVFIGGAAKVFGYDLFEIRGVSLLMSVFSFGAAAALGSVVLGRWQRAHKQAGEEVA